MIPDAYTPQVTAPDFNQGLSNVLSLYEPQEPSYTILDSLVPQPEEPMSMGGLRDAMGRVSQELATGEKKINELSQKREGIKSRMYEMLAKRGGMTPEQAQVMTQDPKEALIAGLLAFAAAQGGARNAIPAFNQFMGTRQGQIAGQNEQAQLALNQEYQRRLQELQAEQAMLDMEMKDATAQISGLDATQTKLYGEYSDMAQAQEVTDRERMKIDSRELIARQAGEQRLAQILAQNEGKLDIARFNAANPEVLTTYNGIYNSGPNGPVLAEQWITGYAQTPEFKNKLTAAQTDVATETANDKRAFRNPKLQEYRDKHLESIANVKRTNAQTEKYKADIDKIYYEFDNEFTTDEEIETLNQLLTQQGAMDEAINSAKLRVKEAQAVLDGFEPGEKGYDNARADFLKWTNVVSLLERELKETEENIKNAKAGKTLAPKGGAVPASYRNPSTRTPKEADRKQLAQYLGSAAESMGLPPELPIMVALVETGSLRNLPHLGSANDHDSVGLFQQRANWGSYDQRTNIEYATNKFLNAAKNSMKKTQLFWQEGGPTKKGGKAKTIKLTKPIGELIAEAKASGNTAEYKRLVGIVAQDAQRSAYGERYGQRFNEAVKLLNG